jgi:hypothetical protein
MTNQAAHSAEQERFYIGIGVAQRRCAACAVCPTLPCAAHRHLPPCTGAGDCPSGLHEHGCYADRDGSACNDPDDHREVASPPGQEVRS